MAKLRHASRKPLYIILSASLLISLAYVGYKYLYPKPESASVFLIAPQDLQYGQTTIIGKLVKDSAVGKTGTYLVVLPDSRPVILSTPNLDSMIGKQVEVTGTLLPGDSTYPMTMMVDSITTK